VEPRWKVLSVDGQSPVRNDFQAESYPLKINFKLDPASFPLLAGNRDPGKLTVLAMTGTTALVRATADRMERNGVLYPGEEIRSVLRGADITHISNEVSFTSGCPPPDQYTNSLQFCSDPRNITLLEDIGTNVVELTGNHLLDYGPEPFLDTLDMYDRQGWLYYGGGRDLQAALQPALLEDHGNKFAFVGCNMVGPSWDWAAESGPGSAPCDLDQLSVEIGDLRLAGYLPIMTFQYSEYYQSNPTDYERRDFLKMAASGAVIVSGSQAHFPAAMEFLGGSFVHYGLGNLFFDQMSHLMPDGTVVYDTRDGFVDRHIFYDGRYISTELVSYRIEDYSRPRLMTDSERQEFLQKIFSAGGW
jgi:poly-gamma-glutamate synthesis protein (capsule biosynthesis protein)